ncbi:MAG: 5'/3'-nucleotidase SurE [Halobacteriales archaeon SW_9_67_25]|jgi:5'-nucleotidase|nr:MAG: 5'/3'-nucleotidase SurE [Halobacteriales archaeon SW_9_67_25]
MVEPSLLLTNDDGADAPGLVRLYEELTAIGNVTVVAPEENQSGVGRTRSHAAVRREHPWGYVLTGTPADCVAYGLRGLETEFDLVISGCNHGPNVGNYVTGRSGTVGAGVEAAFLGTPAVAVSGYHCEDFFPDPADAYDFARPAHVTVELCLRASEADLLTPGTLLNVNVPLDVADPPMQVTRPLPDYDLDVEHDTDPESVDPIEAVGREQVHEPEDGEVVRLQDDVWPGVVGFENPFPPTPEHRERYPEGTDRRALVEGEISVSPLSIDHGDADHEGLSPVVEAYNDGE